MLKFYSHDFTGQLKRTTPRVDTFSRKFEKELNTFVEAWEKYTNYCFEVEQSKAPPAPPTEFTVNDLQFEKSGLPKVPRLSGEKLSKRLSDLHMSMMCSFLTAHYRKYAQ